MPDYSLVTDSGSFSGSFEGTFTGDGSGITGATAEWDGSHTGDATITGNLSVSSAVTASAVSASTLTTDGVATFGTYTGQSDIVTVGALDAGSITSNFGSIDIGSSTFDTTGALAAGNTTITGIVTSTGIISGSSFNTDGPISGSALGVTGAITGSSIDVSGNGTIGGTLDVTGNTTLTGDLTVLGDTFEAQITNLYVEDKQITVASGSISGSAVTTHGAGLEVDRGSDNNVALYWNETTDRWQITNDSSSYYNIPITGDAFTFGAISGSTGTFTGNTVITGSLSVSGSIFMTNGVDPGWATNRPAILTTASSSISGLTDSGQMNLSLNIYHDGSAWKSVSSGYGSQLGLTGGGDVVIKTTSVTASAADETMTLVSSIRAYAANGYVSIGNGTATEQLHVFGNVFATGNITGSTANFAGNVGVTGSLTITDSVRFNDSTLFASGVVGMVRRSSDSTLYLQSDTTGFNILDNSQNTMATFAPALVQFAISNTVVGAYDSSGLTVTGTGAFSSTVGVLSGGVNAAMGILVSGTGLSTAAQYGVFSDPTFSSAATSTGRAIYARVQTAAAAFTMGNGYGINIASPSVGAGSGITNAYGLKIENQAAGTSSNHAIHTGTGLVRFGDTLETTGNAGIGVAPSATHRLYANTSTANAAAVYGYVTGTGAVTGVSGQAVSSGTTAKAVSGTANGAATYNIGLHSYVTSGTNNTYLLLANSAGVTGDYTIYSNSAYQSYLAGKIGIGSTALGGDKLDVYSATATTNLAIFQHNGMSDGYAIINATVGNALTGSANGFRTSGDTTGNLAVSVQQNGTGTAMLDLLTLGTGDAVSRFRINGGQAWSIGLDNSDSDSFKIAGSSGLGTSDYLIISSSGNVGIGTTSPAQLLDISGDSGGAGGTVTNPITARLTCTDTGGSWDLTNPFAAIEFDCEDASGAVVRAKIGAVMAESTGRDGELAFYTTNATMGERMRIDLNGNVGIGTASPTGRLHVVGTGTPGSSRGVSSVVYPFAKTDTTDRNIASWTSNEADGSTWKLLLTAKGNAVTTSRYFSLQTGNEGVANEGNLCLQASGGNVGIGTTSPAVDLHIEFADATAYAGSTALVANREGLQIENTDTTAGAYSAINLRAGSADMGIAGVYDGTTNDGFMAFVMDGGSPFEAMRIDNSGNVGIGTTGPSASLDIAYGGYTGTAALLIGADLGASTARTDATRKYFTIAAPHYTNAEENVGVFAMDCDVSGSILNIGPFTGNFNAPTVIRFWTAANNTTTTTAEAMRIDSSGSLGIGTTGPVNLLHVADDDDSGTYNQASGQLILGGSTNENKRLNLGFDTSTDVGWIQAGINGTGYNDLLLNPNGGNVGIGTTAPTANLHLSSSSSTAVFVASSGNAAHQASLQFMDGATQKWNIVKQSTTHDLEIWAGGQGSPFLTVSQSGDFCLKQQHSSGKAWLTGYDRNHSIVFRGESVGTAKDQFTFYEYGGNLADGRGYRFYTGGVYGDQTVKFHIADNGCAMSQSLFIGDTANANQTIGLTINQGANDDEAFALKSSDVAHAYVANTETDTYLTIGKTSPTLGGASFTSLTESTGTSIGMRLITYGGVADTAKTTAAVGLMQMYVAQHDGANSRQNIAANGNVFCATAWTGGAWISKFLVDEDGDFHYDGADGGAFDAYDDAQLVRAFATATSPKQIVRSRWDEMVQYDESMLVETGILGAPVSEGGLVNGAQLQRLLVGTTWQNHVAIQEQNERLERELKVANERIAELEAIPNRLAAIEAQMKQLLP